MLDEGLSPVTHSPSVARTFLRLGLKSNLELSLEVEKLVDV